MNISSNLSGIITVRVTGLITVKAFYKKKKPTLPRFSKSGDFR